MKLSTSLIILGSVALNAFVSVPLKEIWSKSAYEQGYNECTSSYKQMLLDEGFAEYDKKTAQWHLLDASTIQGNLIPVAKKILYISIEDQIQSYEDELKILKKQKEVISKRQPHVQTAKLDMKKL
jgi:hypothetical protein